MQSSHPNLEYFGDLKVSMTLWDQNRLLQEWGLHSLSEHQEMHFMFLSEHHGQHGEPWIVLLLSSASSGTGNHGGGYVKLFCTTSRRKLFFFFSMFMVSVMLALWTVITFHNNSKGYYP